MKNNYKVYIHTCPNKKVYIGITSQKPNKRWKNGLGYKNNKYFFNAILKYGWDNINHEILFSNLTKEKAQEKEMLLITEYKSNQREFGYNNSAGGESGASGCRWNEESKKLFSEHMKGKPSNAKGKHHSEETKNKLSKKLKGRIISDETKIKMSKSSTRKKEIICIELNKIFESCLQASKITKTNSSHIIQCCKGKRKTANGFHWQYNT